MAKVKKVGGFQIRQHKNASGTTSWRVDGRMPDGKRVRKYFAEEGDAIRERADLELKAVGQSEVRQALRTAFTPAQLADAEAAAEHAGALKLSKVVAHYMSLRDRVSAKNVDLDQAIAFVEARYRPETKAITILNAKAKFLGSKGLISPKTRLNYENGIGQLLKPDPNKFVHAYTVSDIEKVIQRYSNLNTQKTHRRVISVFFNWAVRHHYCLENPCDRLDKLPRDMSQITALSLEESKRLLYAAMQLQDGAAAACVAIGMFAGLRPSEIRDLTPADSLAFAPGEAAQVDWGSAGVITLGATRRRLSFFVMVLCHSRMAYVEFTCGEAMEHFLACHQNALEFFGGTPGVILEQRARHTPTTLRIPIDHRQAARPLRPQGGVFRQRAGQPRNRADADFVHPHPGP